VGGRGYKGDWRSGHWVEWRRSEEIRVLLVRAGACLAVRASHAAWSWRGVEHLCHALVVGLDVGLQLFLVVEGGLAEGALVHFLTKVSHLVQLQHMVVSKALATDVTAVGLLPCVGPHVDLQLLGAGEPLVAGGADVGLLPSVGSHVDNQLARLDEGLVAEGALVWSFSCVNPHVSMKLARVLERSVADCAGVRPLLCVDSHVDRQVLLH